MNIGVIGLGVVGSAVLKSFEKRFIKSRFNIYGYDKYKKIGLKEEMLEQDILFFCLPTQYSSEKKEYDKTAIRETCEYLQKNNYNGLVVIKSTVEPETSVNFGIKYNLRIMHNPEFLTASSAYEDFENQSHIVIGQNETTNDKDLENLKNLYEKNYDKCEVSIAHSTETEMMKLGVNNFYSVKIQFFNELYLLSKKLNNANYDNIKDMMLKNNWINPMHTQVPGTDGKLSYGGMCFPKDTNALNEFMKRQNSSSKVINATIEERNEMRDDKCNLI